MKHLLFLLILAGTIACDDGVGTNPNDSQDLSDAWKSEQDLGASDASDTSDTSDASDLSQPDPLADTGSDTGDMSASLGPLPKPNAGFDYQLGDPYPPPTGVEIVTRDRNASPAQGFYNICYVNGFQTQPDERDFWTANHPELLLRDGNGNVVIDPDWDEIILDVTTPDKRRALAQVVGDWIVGCSTAGFDAVEIDNLDTYSRSGGLVSQDDAVAFMRLLADAAHAQGLPIAQKNSAEVLGRRDEMRTDFAVAEECNRYSECGDYTAVYGDWVFVIEYRQRDFNAGCRDFPGLSIILRDRNLVAPSSRSYLFDRC